jgi:uncharacterized protein YjiS (DUF1127 family)
VTEHSLAKTAPGTLDRLSLTRVSQLLPQFFFGLTLLIQLWLRHRRNRAELLALDADQRTDVGLTPELIHEAVSRKFWNSSTHDGGSRPTRSF